jgi:hypothetical protein
MLWSGVVKKTQIVLTTAEQLPRPESESLQILEALAALGVGAEVVPWTRRRDWAADPLVVIRSTWDYWGRLDEFLAWVRNVGAATRLLNPRCVVEWNARKDYLLDLERRGVAVVPSRLIGKGASVGVDHLRVNGEGEIIVKPTVGAGGHDARRGRPEDERLLAYLREMLTSRDMMVQPFVPAVADDGEVSLVYFGGTFSHAVRKRAAAGEFRIHEHFGGEVEAYTPARAERDAAEAALAAAPAPVAYGRVDLVNWQGRPAVMELELIEPELFLRKAPAAAERFARVLKAQLNGSAA